MIHYGATPEDWDNLDLMLGLTADLLPVVSNPNAPISPQSKMKALGKTPSWYNRRCQVAGIPNWTNYIAKGSDIIEWRKQPDYGICVQTRYVRALDIDVDDLDKSSQIVNFLEVRGFPVRFRHGSGKCLVGFIVEGEFQKRVLKVDGGMIEFLANGQQFVAHGTHPSGERYQWLFPNTGPSFPVITAEEFEKIWQELVDEFGIEEPTTRNKRQRNPDLTRHDPFLDQLDILSWSSDGKKAFIECPFSDQHTTESAESSTCYMPAGSEGYELGHFKCLHAHCEGRADYEFQDALGLVLCEFDPLPVKKDPPTLVRDKQGCALAEVPNIIKILERPDVTGVALRKDVFKEELLISWFDKPFEVIKDTDYTRLRNHLQEFGTFKPITKDMMRDCVHVVAEMNCVDSAQLRVKALKWDGVPRIENFLVDYMGAEDSPYVRAVSIYAWTAMAGRVLEPGVKADMVPTLVGKQGIQKSTGIEAMSLEPDWFVEVSMADKEDDRVRRTKGCVVGEFGEMRGIYSAALESVKAYLVRTHDVWVPKYMEQAVRYPRRIFYWGTSNHVEMFTDTTGNRRWLPVDVKFVNREGIAAVREQLWAEAAVLFEQNGVMYSQAERLGVEVHEKYMIADPWRENIAAWLHNACGVDGETPLTKGYVTTNEILELAIGKSRAAANSGDGKHVSETMRTLDFEKVQRRVDGSVRQVWVPKLSVVNKKADDLL